MVGSTRRRGLFLAVLTLLATTAFSACGSSGNGSGATSGSGSSAAPASIGSLVTASKSENALNVYANIPAELFKHVLDQFTSLYPWIKVNDNELSDPEIFSKVTAEQAQGAPSADLMISTYPLGFAQAGQRGILKTDYSPAGLQNFPSWAKQGPGEYVMEADPLLVGMNTKELDAAHQPHSYDDLAKLADAGQPLTTYPISHPIGYAAVWAYTTQKGEPAWQTLARIAKTTKTIDDGTTQLEAALKGQFAAGYFSSGLGRAFVPQYKGLFEMSYTSDFQELIPRGMAIPSKASHPASAQLFMDFVYSQAGQETLCAAGMTAFANGFQSSTGCTNSLADLQAHVPAANIYVIPFSTKLLDEQAKITARWNTLGFK